MNPIHSIPPVLCSHFSTWVQVSEWGAVMGPSRRRAYCAILLCAMHTGRAFPTSAPPLRFLPVRPVPDEIAASGEKAVALSTIGYGTYRIGRTGTLWRNDSTLAGFGAV